MSGFFSFLKPNFEKEGKGIPKNAPKKSAFRIFFETYFRNFWKFIPLNLVYSFMVLLIIPSGFANVGLTHVARNTARDKHSFGLSDFFETIKKNWAKALPAGIINFVVYIIVAFNIYVFYKMPDGAMKTIFVAMSFSTVIIFTMMNFFIWTLMITFKFSFKQIYKNSFKFVSVNLKRNAYGFISIAGIIALFVVIALIFQDYLLTTLFVEFIVFVSTCPAAFFLIAQYAAFPAIKEHIIDPYYKEHPFEDIERRRNLGLAIEEEEDDEDEDSDDEDDDDDADDDF